MKRRAFLAALALPYFSCRVAAEAKPRIVILHSGFPNRTPIDQLYAALRDLGYEHGRTADIQLFGAEGDPDRLTSLVAKLAQEHPQVIIAVTSPAALALKRANVTTPVVFLFVSDPIRLGLDRESAATRRELHWSDIQRCLYRGETSRAPGRY